MKVKPVVDARRINKMRFISGIVICLLVIAVTFVALTLNLVDFYDSNKAGDSGLHTFRMFTTISNVIAAFAASMCLPFQIDGLRRNRYRLPSWIVIVMYVGAVGVFLTFFVAMTLISAYQGFAKAMFSKSNLFMHTINPLLITLLFVLVVSDTHIKFRYSFLSLAPVTIYMIIYFFMVFVLKKWEDHYYTDRFIPWPVSLLLIIIISFGVCQLLRILHNLTNKYVNQSIERYYKKSPDYAYSRIREAIIHLAEVESKYYYEGDDVYIPVDIIKMLSERYAADVVPLDILYDIYLETYLIKIGVNSGANAK